MQKKVGTRLFKSINVWPSQQKCPLSNVAKTSLPSATPNLEESWHAAPPSRIIIALAGRDVPQSLLLPAYVSASLARSTKCIKHRPTAAVKS